MAAAMIEDGVLPKAVETRYAGWEGAEGRAMLDGSRSLEEIAARVAKEGLDPQPRSGQQEYLENLVGRYL